MDDPDDIFAHVVLRGCAVRERRIDLGRDGRPATLWERVTVRSPPPTEAQVPAPAAGSATAKPSPSPAYRGATGTPKGAAKSSPSCVPGAVSGVLLAFASGVGWAAADLGGALGPVSLLATWSLWRMGLLGAIGVVFWGGIGWALVHMDPSILVAWVYGAAMAGWWFASDSDASASP